MLDGNEGIHHCPIVLVGKSKGCCLICPLVELKNDLWVLLSPIFLCFIFSFGCFGQKTQRLMLGSFLSREENPKAKAFLHGLAVVCLGWSENYFLWVLFKTILLHFHFPFVWFGQKTQRLLLGCFLF